MEAPAPVVAALPPSSRPVRRRLRRRHGWRRAIEYRALQAAIAVAGRLPAHLAGGLARLVGWAAPLSGEYWRTALWNLARAFGRELDEPARRRIARAAFEHLARVGVEMARIYSGRSMPGDQDFDVVGMEHFRNAANRGKGVVLLSGHLGNWELFGMWLARTGHPIAAIARLQPNPLINRFIMARRQKAGIVLLPKNCPWEVIRGCLADRYAIGFLADQHRGPSSIAVSFLGIETGAPKGPVLAALRTGAAVVPAAMVRAPMSGRHVVHFAPAVELERTGNLQRDLRINTQKAMAVLEAYVRRYPEQWLWMHRRGRTAAAASPERPGNGRPMPAADAPGLKSGTTMRVRGGAGLAGVRHRDEVP